MSGRKKIALLVLVLLLVALGFLRDSVFVSVNRAIESGLDPAGRLSLIKWALTGVFSLAFLINTCGLQFIIFGSVRFVRWAIYVYAFLLFAAGVWAAAGYLFFSFGNVYPYIRKVMGIVQSPVVAMILIPFCLIASRNDPAIKS